METAKTGCEKLSRLLGLTQSILEMVLGDKRNSEEVCDVLQVIKNDKDFATTLGRRTMSELVKKQLAAWAKLYCEGFGIRLDTNRIKIPAHQNGCNRLIVVAQGLTSEKIYAAIKRKMPAWKYRDNLDGIESVRKANKTYAVWVRDRREADEELKNKSANDLKSDGVNCITLEERLLLEMMYFWETGQHLDIRNITLCAGSRFSDGFVPYVFWSDGKLYVFWYYPADAAFLPAVACSSFLSKLDAYLLKPCPLR